MPTAGVSRNVKGKSTALAAFNAAVKILVDKTTEDVVDVYTEGEATCARVTIAEHKYNLTDVLRTWGCCARSLSKQVQLCRHHVLVLMHIFPEVHGTTFSNQLLRLAGRKFGANGMCYPRVGGMQPLCDTLSALQQEVETAPHSKQSTAPALPPAIQPAIQPNTSDPLIERANALMAAYQKQQLAAHASAAPSNISRAVQPTCTTSVQSQAVMALTSHTQLQCAQNSVSASAQHLDQAHLQASGPLQHLQASFVDLQAPEDDVVCASDSPRQQISKMTPSKRCTDEGTTDLKAMLQAGLDFVEDPSDPSRIAGRCMQYYSELDSPQ
jgi:hypothetical protein